MSKSVLPFYFSIFLCLPTTQVLSQDHKNLNGTSIKSLTRADFPFPFPGNNNGGNNNNNNNDNINKSMSVRGRTFYPNDRIIVSMAIQPNDNKKIKREETQWKVLSELEISDLPTGQISGIPIYEFAMTLDLRDIASDLGLSDQEQRQLLPDSSTGFVRMTSTEKLRQFQTLPDFPKCSFTPGTVLDDSCFPKADEILPVTDFNDFSQLPRSNEKYITIKNSIVPEGRVSFRDVNRMDRHGRDYYENINAFREKRTLGDFKRRNGFLENNNQGFFGNNDRLNKDVVTANFYNNQDLQFGRDIACIEREVPPGTTLEDEFVQVACYSANYGDNPEGGQRDPQRAIRDAIQKNNNNLIATVAMEYIFGADSNTPNGVRFYVYDANNQLSPLAVLDRQDEKVFPDLCTSCHGGRIDTETMTLTGSNFLPFDTEGFLYVENIEGFSLEEQEENFRKLNTIIFNSNPVDTVKEYITETYSNSLKAANTKADQDWIPTGWQSRPRLYNEVYQHYCRACHMTSPISFPTADSFLALKDLIVRDVCETHTMPHAEKTMELFWRSNARSVLLEELGVMHPCKPDAPPPEE